MCDLLISQLTETVCLSVSSNRLVPVTEALYDVEKNYIVAFFCNPILFSMCARTFSRLLAFHKRDEGS
jgi:hypothetical protein